MYFLKMLNYYFLLLVALSKLHVKIKVFINAQIKHRFLARVKTIHFGPDMT